MITEINANANLIHAIISTAPMGDYESMAEVVASSVNNLSEKVSNLSATEVMGNNKEQQEEK
jgi:hypothetical protein